ncbi:MAG: DUF4388 domain-containing protein [Anaerolineae bacterium]|nr:DUF4388 domain-containing protein [Gemmatimonadaceae bacterium]
MPIEGPLRELGIHDVFQLLDLSRKTGALTVTSALRDNQGHVYFDRGAVIFATVRSNPRPLGELLLRAGRVTQGDLDRALAVQRHEARARAIGEVLCEQGVITRRELERQVRFQVEEIIFELMSWTEGYFSFEERNVEDAPAEANVRIATESLLMEGARRIDEWARIERTVPDAGVVPALAFASEDHASHLDLLPAEWEVLAEIDGARDIRGIATHLARSEFDVAKVVYGLVCTGIAEVHVAVRGTQAPIESDDAASHFSRARAALADGKPERALEAARQGVAGNPESGDGRFVLAVALTRVGRHADAAEELRRAVQLDALNPDIHLEMGYSAARRGEFAGAVAAWARYVRMTPAADAALVTADMEAAARLGSALRERGYV